MIVSLTTLPVFEKWFLLIRVSLLSSKEVLYIFQFLLAFFHGKVLALWYKLNEFFVMLGIAKIGIVALLLSPWLLHLLLANMYTGLLCARPSSEGVACNSLCFSSYLSKNLWVLYYNFPHWLMHKTIAFLYLEIQIKRPLDLL